MIRPLQRASWNFQDTCRIRRRFRIFALFSQSWKNYSQSLKKQKIPKSTLFWSRLIRKAEIFRVNVDRFVELMNNILENTVEKISKQSWKKVKKYIIFSSQTCCSKFVLEAFLKLMCRLCCAFAALICLLNSLRTTKPCSCTVLISCPDRGKGMLQLYFQSTISLEFAPRWLSKHNFYLMKRSICYYK